MKLLLCLLSISLTLFACEEEKKNDSPSPHDLRYGSFIDSRDNQEYSTVQIGSQKWMAENLNWASKGFCFEEDSSNCDIYGRMYSSIEMLNGEIPVDENEEIGIQGIYPNGWHIISSKEWNKLLIFLGVEADSLANYKSGYRGINALVGNKLKANRDWSLTVVRQFANESGFGALPTGNIHRNAGGMLISAALGSSTEFYTASYFDSTKMDVQIRTLKDDVSGTGELGIRFGRNQIDDESFLTCRCIED